MLCLLCARLFQCSESSSGAIQQNCELTHVRNSLGTTVSRREETETFVLRAAVAAAPCYAQLLNPFLAGWEWQTLQFRLGLLFNDSHIGPWQSKDHSAFLKEVTEIPILSFIHVLICTVKIDHSLTLIMNTKILTILSSVPHTVLLVWKAFLLQLIWQWFINL